MHKGSIAVVTPHSVYVWPYLGETLMVAVDPFGFLLSVLLLVNLHELQRPQRISSSL